jgi:hypothetical protein
MPVMREFKIQWLNFKNYPRAKHYGKKKLIILQISQSDFGVKTLENHQIFLRLDMENLIKIQTFTQKSEG